MNQIILPFKFKKIPNFQHFFLRKEILCLVKISTFPCNSFFISQGSQVERGENCGHREMICYYLGYGSCLCLSEWLLQILTVIVKEGLIILHSNIYPVQSLYKKWKESGCVKILGDILMQT